MVWMLTRGASFQWCVALRQHSATSWCRVPLPCLKRTLDEPPEHQKCRQCAREMAWASRRPVTRDLRRPAA